ncbi:heat-inducible transcriptional repressor HrcA [Candidatus Methylobacter oryzae]|uniref:Heat-inducible transcription repressor HrcA n=1 Tax=Candidatus Methylobacter oryzae TaxID=2497749 RepID=A0ABY3CDJ4_9GAMM|nr:heat-inducible transcriptional repressor HrcA [Candidatus Methylobacter oryzae]TRX00701.1 heat-inducible transcriptional repressor HrcA [Candidatus Methylobacter oryzae]
MSSNTQVLNERSLQLLKTLVERYISDGQPVGSRALSKDSDLNLSPATIRNVMADLEDLGLVHSPHTSAGRVPTVSGYRLFVDSLLTVKPLESKDLTLLHQSLSVNEDPNNVIGTASRLLSELTQMAGVVTLPKREVVCLRHIEFLSLSHTRVLVIFVTNEQEVHNRIIHTSKIFSPAELQQAANYLNSIYSGRSLDEVRKALLKELQDDQERMNQGMLDAVKMAQLAFDQDNKKDDYVLTGETNLMGFSELSDMERLKNLFEAFSQKQGVIHLLDQCMKADGVQIFIGEESGYRAFDHCSLVTSSYSVSDEVVGVLGVIGPTRMAYEKIIPFVDVTAKLLGAALNPKSTTPL